MAKPDLLLQQIKAAVERRGAKARQLWMMASGYNPLVSPNAALANLKNLANVVRADFDEEAKALIRDLEALIK